MCLCLDVTNTKLKPVKRSVGVGHLLIVSLAQLNALLAADKCTIHCAVLMNLTNLSFSEVSAQMQTVHRNLPNDKADCLFLRLQ